MINGFIVNEIFINGRENNEFFKVFSDLFLRNVRVMLTRDENSVNSDWDKGGSFVGIFDSNLGFSVWSDPGNNFLFSALINSFTKSGG